MADGKIPITATISRASAIMIHRHVWSKWRALLDHTRHYVMHNILHADDPPHRLALGAAIAIFVSFTPTVGIQTPTSIFLAWLFRANKAVGIPIVWISNPATLIPIYYWCYTIGRKLLGQPAVGRAWWSELSAPPPGWWETLAFYWTRFGDIATPLWLGGAVVGLALGVPTYYVTLVAIRSYRMKRWGQLTPPPPEAGDG